MVSLNDARQDNGLMALENSGQCGSGRGDGTSQVANPLQGQLATTILLALDRRLRPLNAGDSVALCAYNVRRGNPRANSAPVPQWT